MCTQIPMHTAEIWKKYIEIFYFLKAFLSINWDKYFALYWCCLLGISPSEQNPCGGNKLTLGLEQIFCNSKLILLHIGENKSRTVSGILPCREESLPCTSSIMLSSFLSSFLIIHATWLISSAPHVSFKTASRPFTEHAPASNNVTAVVNQNCIVW